ncbi:MAG TPA: OmpA family protein [Parafilimonas sp.]|nr:OmpA family protein [Parafilimonas sp.]
MKKIILYAITFSLIIASCKSLNNTQKGTAIGTTAGAATGAIIAGKHNTVLGAIIGAAVGGAGGYAIGRSMDKQAEKIKQQVPDAQVERVGEGINVTFNSALLFQINLYDLSDSAKENLDKMAGIFNEYPETNILVEGHTDDTGTEEFNEQLSEKRAETVANYLEAKGVNPSRFTVKWYGETQPKYPNNSDANRKLNRRVELGIIANDQMKKEAKSGDLNNQ